MDSQLSDALEHLEALEDSIHRNDWASVSRLAALLPREFLAPPRDDIGEYLTALRRTLSMAKVSRAHAVASLARIQAAARFNERRSDGCQNFAGVLDL
jgi:hypothetical protein